MITDILLNIIFFFGRFFLGLLPTASLPADFSASLTTASGYFISLNAVLPATALFAAFGTILVAEGLIFLYKGIKWVYNKIPGIN